jgi:hypothetical protein
VLQCKSEAVAVIGVILQQIQDAEILHSDQGGEHMGRKMAQLLEGLGIWHIPAPSYTPLITILQYHTLDHQLLLPVSLIGLLNLPVKSLLYNCG